MDKKILESAKRNIDFKRFEAENNAVNNKIKALENQDFKAMYDKYINEMIENAKLGKNNNDKELKSQLDKKLAEMGIGPIEPQYSCKICNDNGSVDGKYCKCLIDELNSILKKESG